MIQSFQVYILFVIWPINWVKKRHKSEAQAVRSWDTNPWSNFATLAKNSSVLTNDTQHGILPLWKMGETISLCLGGTLNFHLLLVELSQMGGLKIFRLFWGDSRVFSAGGMGRVSAPLIKNLLSPCQPVKIPPSRQKVHPPLH